MQENLEGDCKEILNGFKDNFFSAIVSDPPYALTSKSHFSNHDAKTGFMGCNWDREVPSIEILNECYRVLKPGAFAFFMCASRLDCMLKMGFNLVSANFQVNFSPLYWVYASGMPKAQSVSKKLAKRGNKTSNLEGGFLGFQPKPAVELILVCMKPCNEKNFINQAVKTGTGLTWLEECRIPISKQDQERSGFGHQTKGFGFFESTDQKNIQMNPDGRMPPNLLVDDDALNDGIKYKGDSINRGPKRGGFRNKYIGGSGKSDYEGVFHCDIGSFSKFFDINAWWQKRVEKLPAKVKKIFPFLNVKKPANNKKWFYCRKCKQAFQYSNYEQHVEHEDYIKRHETLKPVKLMSYLILLSCKKINPVTSERSIILDPFAGSGTTGIAAYMNGYDYVVIERDPENYQLAKARLKNTTNQKRLDRFT